MAEADYDRAIGIMVRTQRASTSFLQREIGVANNAAARLMERAEAEGIVSKPDAVGKRHVAIAPAAPTSAIADGKPLQWIAGGLSTMTYANAFGIFGFYRIVGERAPWSLQYPEGTCFRTDDGFETQAAARRFAQDHYAGLLREARKP